MSLKIWLPLNGSLHNQGLNNVMATNNGATINDNGKIGKCYSFNGSSNYITIPQSYIGDEWSYSIWAYTTSSSATQTLGCCRTSVGSGFSLFLIGGKLRIDSGGNNIQHTTTYSYPVNTWFHLTVTYEDGKISYYINGEFKNSYTDTISSTYWGNIFSIGASQANGSNYGNYLNGRVNDVRIYDNCLSPKEIKELSKGLVLHYALNDTSIQVLNNNYNYPTFNTSAANAGWNHWGGTGNKGHYGQNTDKNYIYRSDQDYSHWFSNDADATANYLLYQSPAFEGGFRSLQCICKEENGLEINESIIHPDWNSRDGGALIGKWTSIIPLKNNFYLCKCEGIKQSGSNDLIGFYVHPGYKVYISEAYVENDREICSDILFANNVVYDVSGYQNNGTITGSLTCSSDTPRYMVSTYFNGGDNAITVPFNSVISDATIPFTINLWFKKSELGTDNYESLFGGPSGFEMDTRSGSATSLSLYMASTRGGAMYSPFNLNEWYMVTMASDRTNEYYYVNGELAKTITAKSMPVGSYFIGAWQVYNKQNYKGLISDFRIYSTCLSADDILALYNTPASITSNGTLLTQGEISEV